VIETDLYQLLSENQTVLDALGDRNNVFLGMIPKDQPDTPAIVVRTPGASYLKSTPDGTLNMVGKKVQIDSYHAQYTKSITISNVVRDLLKDFIGPLSTTTVRSVVITQDMDMPYEQGPGGYVFRRMLEFHVWYVDGLR
jgi:hypothetical protein